MKKIIFFLLITTAALISCGKYEVEPVVISGPLPVTEAVKAGDWMVTYFENNVQGDMGLTFLKFNAAGTVVATKDGTPYNGTWKETNTNGVDMLTINITTTDTKLQRTNRAWKVTSITEYFIDLKDPASGGIATVQLMKH